MPIGIGQVFWAFEALLPKESAIVWANEIDQLLGGSLNPQES